MYFRLPFRYPRPLPTSFIPIFCLVLTAASPEGRNTKSSVSQREALYFPLLHRAACTPLPVPGLPGPDPTSGLPFPAGVKKEMICTCKNSVASGARGRAEGQPA